MLLIQFPGAEARRTQIEAAMARAMAAGGDRRELEDIFEAVGIVFATLSITSAALYPAVVMAFLEAFETNEAGMLKKLAETFKITSPPIGGLCEQLVERYNRYAELRKRQPEVANHFATAIGLLEA